MKNIIPTSEAAGPSDDNEAVFKVTKNTPVAMMCKLYNSTLGTTVTIKRLVSSASESALVNLT